MKESDNKELSVINIIAQGTQLEGSIVTNGDCRIDGVVRGSINSKAKVIIGRSGKVEGNIACGSIDIEGTINAETLNVSDLVFLKETANVIANIVAGKIAIEPGAEFSGNCQMHNEKANAPVAEPQTEKR